MTINILRSYFESAELFLQTVHILWYWELFSRSLCLIFNKIALKLRVFKMRLFSYWAIRYRVILIHDLFLNIKNCSRCISTGKYYCTSNRCWKLIHVRKRSWNVLIYIIVEKHQLMCEYRLVMLNRRLLFLHVFARLSISIMS